MAAARQAAYSTTKIAPPSVTAQPYSVRNRKICFLLFFLPSKRDRKKERQQDVTQTGETKPIVFPINAMNAEGGCVRRFQPLAEATTLDGVGSSKKVR